MPRPRFRIGTLLACVLFVAFGLAALRESSDLWDSLVFSLTVVLLTGGTLLAALRDTPARRFWLGFSLAGWVYLGASLNPGVESRLLTTKGLSFAASKLLPEPQGLYTVAFTPGGQKTSFTSMAFTKSVRVTSGPTAANGVRIWNASTGQPFSGPGATPMNFVRIGHSVLTLALAFLAGRLCLRLRRESDEGRELSVDPGQAAG